MAEIVPDFSIKEVESVCFICIVSITGRLNCAPLYLKKFEKFVQPTNENFTTFCKKHVYESWRKLFPALVSKKLKGFCFLLKCIYKGKTKDRSALCP